MTRTPFPETENETLPAGTRKVPATIRILVIDDDEEDYFAVRKMLDTSTTTEYRSTYASTYEEAVTELKSANYDVVLLDYFISGKSAEDVYRAVDGRWNVPVIVFTGSHDVTLEDQVLEAGAFDFLNKNSMCAESLMQSTPDEFKTYSATIHDSSNHVMKLIDDFLELSQAGPESFDVKDRRFRRSRTTIADTDDKRRRESNSRKQRRTGSSVAS